MHHLLKSQIRSSPASSGSSSAPIRPHAISCLDPRFSQASESTLLPASFADQPSCRPTLSQLDIFGLLEGIRQNRRHYQTVWTRLAGLMTDGLVVLADLLPSVPRARPGGR
ncbi:unnamed protein product [Protopolystoma xenopodis]|uniref:Uncharacterized protein n=1 Tax=Protopolystoma xenopodis TaxID=117903 RepID=A0A3S5BCN8_9PLAT|nr:unnamed protein product [Protopolystoma xenopodis]